MIARKREKNDSVNEIARVLGASKGLGSGRGKSEFVIESGEFIVVIEDKPRADQIVKLTDDGAVDLEYPARDKYALR